MKLRRGHEHLDALEQEFERFHADDISTVVCEFDPKESKYFVRFKVLKPIPQHSWGLILGDAVHNARTALDYIAWRLAGNDLNDLVTFFPICRHQAKFKSVEYRLKRLHRSAFAEIRDLQPYNRPDPDHSLLWLLEELDARDKHKLIAMTQSITRARSFKGKGQILIPYAAIEQPIEHDTVLAEFSQPPGQDVEMEFEFASHVIFDRGVLSAASGNYGVIRVLREAFDAVEFVIDLFDRLLRGNPHWLP